MATTYINPFVFGEALGGMVLLTPTSIAYSGTSATIGANGSVEFSACTSLSLNGVFSATYDNYMIAIRHLSSGQGSLQIRLRLSGSDESGSNYTYQQLAAAASTVSGTRVSTTSARIGQSSNANRSGDAAYFYGPYLAQPTAIRNINVQGRDGSQIVDYASTHSLSTSYDGFTVINEGDSLSGLVSVYGLVGA